MRSFAIFVAHTESRSPCLNALQLILKHVAPSVALNNEQDFPPLHLIQIFVAVAPDLAYDRLERFVGAGAFFGLSPCCAFISSWMVDGTKSHSVRISTMVFTI